MSEMMTERSRISTSDVAYGCHYTCKIFHICSM